MFRIHRADQRGQTQLGWLDSRHSFSFGDYLDPGHMGYRSLRVINDDRVAPGAGFPMHPHRDMEILTWVLEGKLEHRDSLGSGSVVGAGEIQRMTAGRGIRHSEFNPSADEPVRLLQIWLHPDRKGLDPSYEQRAYADDELRDRLALVASPDGRGDSVRLNQDALLHVARLSAGKSLDVPLTPGRRYWLQIATGSVRANGSALGEGDAVAVEDEPRLRLIADSASEVLLFDLA